MNKHLKRLYDKHDIQTQLAYITTLEDAYIEVMDRLDEKAAVAANSQATDWGSSRG